MMTFLSFLLKMLLSKKFTNSRFMHIHIHTVLEVREKSVSEAWLAEKVESGAVPQVSLVASLTDCLGLL